MPAAAIEESARLTPVAGLSDWVGRILALATFALVSASCEWPAGEGGADSCGCGAPPRCGQVCTAKCGCCPIFSSSCAPQGIIVGQGSCYDLTPCSGPDRCVWGKQGPVCAESNRNCDDVRVAYEDGLKYSLTVRSGAPALSRLMYIRDIFVSIIKCCSPTLRAK